MTKRVSIIVSIYNVDQYLDQCIQSLVNQTYANIEIILVNDGSTDHSFQLCQRWAKHDSRIVLLNKANGGLADARNFGLQHAHGELVQFVDGDDWVAPEMVKTMVDAITSTDADQAICQYILAYPHGNNRLAKDVAEPIKVLSQEALLKLLLQDDEITNHAWRRMYKTSLIPPAPFEEGIMFEDVEAAFRLVSKCHRIVSINKPLYFYRQRESSIVNQQWSVKKLTDRYTAYDDEYQAINKAYPGLSFRVAQAAIHCYKEFFTNSAPFKEDQTIKALRRRFMRRLRQMSLRQNVGLHFKLVVLRFKLLPWLPPLPIHSASLVMKLRKLKYCYSLRRQITSPQPKFVIIGVPDYGNLGDWAIYFGVAEFIKRYFPGYHLVPISIGDTHFVWHLHLRLLRNIIFSVTGGGNMGTLYPHFNSLWETALHALKRQRALIFPQTFYYSADQRGRQFADNNTRLYRQMDKLLVFTRDESSYRVVRDQLNYPRVKLMPDMALILKPHLKYYERAGALVALRDDQEQILSKGGRDHLIRVVTATTDGQVRYTDTHLHYDGLGSQFAKQRLAELLDRYAHAQFVVTDRLHGMILAAITNTPCVAVLSQSPKVKGVYDQWLKENDFIELVEDLADLPRAIKQVTSVKDPQMQRTKINAAFAEMAQQIKKLAKQ